MDDSCNFLVTYPLLAASAEPVFCKERTRYWRNVGTWRLCILQSTCSEPILDNRLVWLAGVCVSTVACGTMDWVLAAGLVVGVAESPVGSWAEPGLQGCGGVCWSISG